MSTKKKTKAKKSKAPTRKAPQATGQVVDPGFLQASMNAGAAIGDAIDGALRGGGRLSLNVGPNGLFDYIKPPEERRLVFIPTTPAEEAARRVADGNE